MLAREVFDNSTNNSMLAQKVKHERNHVKHLPVFTKSRSVEDERFYISIKLHGN